MLGEVVALEAEGADPNLGNVINNAEGVEDGAAHAAAKGRVGQDWGAWDRLERGIDGSSRDDTAQGLLLCAWEDVPSHSHPIL